MYSATLCGKIINKHGKEMKQSINHRGYMCVRTYDGTSYKNHRVSRFVYAHFHGPIPEGMQVDHVNNNKTDNRLSNLQLLSNADNTRKRQSNKLDESSVREIRSLLGHMTGRALAQKFGVSEATISSIKNSTRWGTI